MQGIKHHLLDVVDPKKQFSVSEYKTLADNSLRHIVMNHKLPIIVGGTGFYIDAITGRANFPDVPPNKLLRDKLNKLNKEKLFEILKKKDPKRAETIDANNKVRLVRALEIIETLGHVPKPNYLLPTTYSFTYIGLKPDDLEDRIYKRLIKRIPGIIRETKKLSHKRAHELGLEYRFASLYLQKKLTRQDLVEKLNTAICQYTKRQMAWFKRNKKIRWFGPSQYKAIEKYVS